MWAQDFNSSCRFPKQIAWSFRKMCDQPIYHLSPCMQKYEGVIEIHAVNLEIVDRPY